LNNEGMQKVIFLWLFETDYSVTKTATDTICTQTGKNTGKSKIKAVNPIATARTIFGLTLSPLSSSVSKYLINPADDANPLFFSFFAIK